MSPLRRPRRYGITARVSVILSERLLNSLALAALTIFAARRLGPGLYAAAIFATGVVAMIVPLLDTGQVALLRRLQESRNSVRAELRAPIRLAYALLLFFLPMVILIALTAPPELRGVRPLLLIAAISLILKPIAVFEYVLQAKSRIVIMASVRLIVTAAGAGVRVVALVALSQPTWAARLFCSAPVAEAIVAASAYLILLYRSPQPDRPRTHSPVLSYARDVAPYMLTAAAVVLYLRIDTLLLGYLSTASQLASYGVATRVSEVGYFIPVALGQVLGPTLVSPGAGAVYALNGEKRRVLCLFSLLALILLLGVEVLARPTISFLFGNVYVLLGASAVLRVHALSLPFVFMGVWQQYISVADGTGVLAAYRTVTALGCNVLLNVLLIPHLGATGAALATAVSYALAAVGLNLLSPRTRYLAFEQLRALNPVYCLQTLKTAPRAD